MAKSKRIRLQVYEKFYKAGHLFSKIMNRLPGLSYAICVPLKVSVTLQFKFQSSLL
jgi:hypothetical protein